jgi:polyisoprenoid-binding protein YceI
MTTKWKIDPSHSELQFKVKHLMISTISGYFHSYNLEVLTEGDDFITASKIEFTADVGSISTKNEQRDAHLKSAEFFNAGEHVVISFSGKKFEQKADEYLLHDDLTIKGVTRPGKCLCHLFTQNKRHFTGTGRKPDPFSQNHIFASGHPHKVCFSGSREECHWPGDMLRLPGGCSLKKPGLKFEDLSSIR